ELPYFIAIDENGLFAGLRTANQASVARYELTNNGVSANTWHHVAVTLNATTRALTLYLDGVQVAGSVTAGTASANTAPLTIGQSVNTADFFLGSIDDVRIWNVVRSPTDIQANYRIEYADIPTGLVANWQFNEGT